MAYRRTLLCGLLILMSGLIEAQTDTAAVAFADSAYVADTTQHKPFYTQLWSHDPHSVGRAALYSAIIPGLGQAYNGKYWKIPIVYGALGTAGYFVWYWYDFYDELRTAYIARTDEDPFTIDLDYAYIPSDDILLQYVEQSRRYLDVMVIVSFGVYALNIIDAIVDAHLYAFDVSDDLTMHWQPAYFPNRFGAQSTYGAFGVHLNLQLK